MKRTLMIFIALFSSLLLFINSAGAQDMGTVNRIGYYLAADTNGVQQVYQLLLDGQSQARQITSADEDVLSYTPAFDGLSVAYISAGYLWLQPIHTETAEALAPVSGTHFMNGVVFSQDGLYLAYPSEGVWLLNLSTRETRQLLANVPLDESGSNMAEYRLYFPKQFVLGADGQSEKIIVDIGVWEWNTAGVYDLMSDELHVLQNQLHSDLLPLYGDRVLVFGNNGVSGDFSLYAAQTLDDINNASEVVQFADLTDLTLFANQAIEIHPGTVRVSGEAIGPLLDETRFFYFDYDLMAGTAGSVNTIIIAAEVGGTFPGELSPDGALLPVYKATEWHDSGSLYGQLTIIDLVSGSEMVLNLPATIGAFRWQP